MGKATRSSKRKAAAAEGAEKPIEKPRRKSSKKSSRKEHKKGKRSHDKDRSSHKSRKESKKRSSRRSSKKESSQPARTSGPAESVLSEVAFDSLPVSGATKSALAKNGFQFMTKIQREVIPVMMQRRDVIGAAMTGSGKTLAFLVPVIEQLHSLHMRPKDGTGAIVISPTRELALQIYSVARDLMESHSQTVGVVMGGANRAAEVEKLQKGLNLVVATPGRLLDHLSNTKGFCVEHLSMLVIDEADHILDIGYQEEMSGILRALPATRTTSLFSATLTPKVKELARDSLRADAHYIGVDDERDERTTSGLVQGYVTCPTEKRFLLLYTFLKMNRGKKVIVFFSSCSSVRHHCDLLNYIDMPCVALHGKQKQQKRTATFFEFCNAKAGTLLCTDVAARGLDIPAVDWIVQYDPPSFPEEYIHRVGRTCRGVEGREGKALLLLQEHELPFIQYLRKSRVPLYEYNFPSAKLANIQRQLERLIASNYHLNSSARDAFKNYIHAYSSHSLKDAFDIHRIDMGALARSFGLAIPPRVALETSDRSARTIAYRHERRIHRQGKQ
eukprot:gnl/Chilomastix_cuspidata/153.p1 GENE.gnl/Chilomastix_cuspidata/153~~gnl/Chilomastix_cuspidata/153.p1  ORF type:complete len:558 (-),score=257.06 gnl/Chilomastix_cuspidata/153:784-2457(-)